MFDNVDSECDAGGFWLRLRTLENRGGIVNYGIRLSAMVVLSGISDSYMRRNGHWLLAASQASRLQAK